MHFNECTNLRLVILHWQSRLVGVLEKQLIASILGLVIFMFEVVEFVKISLDWLGFVVEIKSWYTLRLVVYACMYICTYVYYIQFQYGNISI